MHVVYKIENKYDKELIYFGVKKINDINTVDEKIQSHMINICKNNLYKKIYDKMNKNNINIYIVYCYHLFKGMNYCILEQKNNFNDYYNIIHLDILDDNIIASNKRNNYIRDHIKKVCEYGDI